MKHLHNKELLKQLGFSLQESTAQSYRKTYSKHGGYAISLDPHNERIDYGDKIRADSATTQNFGQAENWVVLECVNRLLEQGYAPERIVLEKTWPAGHGTSGRLDICIEREDGSDYLLIECKTAGIEYNKACARMLKDGGQLFTYFKFSNQADVIMLYASSLEGGAITYQNSIVKIEDVYRNGGAQDFYVAWNKLPVDNGVFEAGVQPYDFQSRALKLVDLQPITEAHSHTIFNQFLEILRHNVVSDKPNAFNKIFTLFLCKVFDEKDTKEDAELRFQWLEGRDDHVSFQLRLTDLYRLGMKDFLDKDVTDFGEGDFKSALASLTEAARAEVQHKIQRLRLEKNNEFAIKEVFDHTSFEDNAKVVKEVVQLLQGFRIRYNKRHQYLSDFFELLLTTGLKQEVGQFFTPVPIAQFIIKSLPLADIVQRKLEAGRANELLPYVIDYAAGSGHFLTETMHEMQGLIDKASGSFSSDTKRRLTSWQGDHFAWAEQYIYGVEKDYRLVKVGKVGCYLHGDGLANIVLSDGLGSFRKNTEYKDKLTISQADNPQQNAQFDVVVSNPPYSVAAFKPNSRRYYGEEDFLLYNHISDDGSEIEALFIERTLQLLKEGGVAGVVLPRSFLSNGGVYERARSMLLEGCELIALAEFGSNTFMATGTNTVVVFCRRRSDLVAQQINRALDKFFADGMELVIHGIAKPISDYLAHVWGNLPFADYVSLLRGKPSEAVLAHELYQRYVSELVRKNSKQKKDAQASILVLEKQKLLHFILAHGKEVVVIKSGADKEEEQAFLGYKFSNRRGNEGIHPVRGKRIDDCTQMFDAERFDNPEVASTYVLDAFAGKASHPIPAKLAPHIHRLELVDMLTFGNASFDKSLGTFVKKKASTLTSKWPLVRLGDVCKVITDGDHQAPPKAIDGVPFVTISNIKNNKLDFSKTFFVPEAYYANLSDTRKPQAGDVLYTVTASYGIPVVVPEGSQFCFQRHIALIRTDQKLSHKFLYCLLLSESLIEQGHAAATGVTQKTVSLGALRKFQIPLPPLAIQQLVVSEFEALEQKESVAHAQVIAFEKEMQEVFENHLAKGWPQARLQTLAEIKKGSAITKKDTNTGSIKVIAGGLNFAYLHNKANRLANTITVSASGANAGYVNYWTEPIFASDCTTIRGISDLDTRYLFYYLRSQQLTIYGFARGAAQPHVYSNDLAALLAPVLSQDAKESVIEEMAALEAKRDKALLEVGALKAQKANVLQAHL